MRVVCCCVVCCICVCFVCVVCGCVMCVLNVVSIGCYHNVETRPFKDHVSAARHHCIVMEFILCKLVISELITGCYGDGSCECSLMS